VCDGSAVKRQRSADLRERSLVALDAGRPPAEVAQLFGVSRRTLRRWRLQRAGGQLAPKPRPGRPRRIGPYEAAALAAQVRAHPDATLADHCDRWATAHGTRVSVATMCRALARLGLTLKKRL
jgi:transposase